MYQGNYCNEMKEKLLDLYEIELARKAVMQYGTVCSNAGFLGSPLAEGLFGGGGLLLTSFYLIPEWDEAGRDHPG